MPQPARSLRRFEFSKLSRSTSTTPVRLLCAPFRSPSRFAARLAFLSPLIFAALKPDDALAQRPLGIDVSSYQGSGINWNLVKGGGYVFAWAKATEGEYFIDADFAINENNGKAAGVYMGAYDFVRPDQYAPASEAAYFWNTAGSYIQGDGLTLNPMCDFETFNGIVGASSYSDWCNQWCNWVVAEGTKYGVNIKPFLYTSACDSYFDNSVSQWFPDIANYGSVNGGNDPQTGTPWSSCSGNDWWGGWTMWQYESINNNGVPGYNGNGGSQTSNHIDCDVYNGSLSGLTNQVLVTSSATGGVFSYWDPQANNSQNPYTGSMSATWEDAHWSTAQGGQATPINWVENKCCVIGVHTTYPTTPAFTITVTNNHFFAGLFMGGLSGQGPANVTLSGPGTISLSAGPQGLWVSSPGSLNFGVSIAGDGVAVPQSGGSLYFNASNSFSGGTSIGFYANTAFTGVLYFNNNYAFGTGVIATSNCFGVTLTLEGSSPVTVTNSWLIPVASSIRFSNTAALTFSGPWTLNNSLILADATSASSVVNISGPISGSGALLKTNVGILALSGTNTYSGNTSIANGTLKIVDPGKLGNGNYSRAITNNGTFIYSSTAAQTFSGVISGTGSITVSNGGVLTLSGNSNTYSGATTVSFGSALDISSSSSLGSSASITLNGGTLKNNNSQPILTSARTITLGANGGYLDAGWAPTNTFTINSPISGSGALLINQDGSPVMLGSTGNSYSGNTIIGTNGPASFASGTAAWLKLGASGGVIPTGPGKGDVYIYSAYNGLLDLNGYNPTINGLWGDGTITNSSSLGATLGVGNNNQTSTFDGVIGNGVGTVGLTKTGTGTLTLNGINTYSGYTYVSAGTLVVSSTGSINTSAGVLSISAGGTLDVSANPTFALSGTITCSASGSASPASIVGASGGTVSLGSRPITLNYDGTHPALTIPQGTLVLNGNAFTVNGSALPVGIYTIVSQSIGSVSASGALTVSGTAIGAGKLGSISVNGGNVNLVVQEAPAFSNLSASPSIAYGATSVALSGKVSASGPVYPASGETVTVTINGNAQNTTISDSTGDFSISYNAAAIPVSSNAYTIQYSYLGDDSLTASYDITKTLTVNPRAAVLFGKRAYDGTAVAAAGILSVSNRVGSDAVTVVSGSGTLASTNVGTQAITSLGSLTLGGAAVGNYTLAGASGYVVITAPPFSISSTALDNTGSNIVITWQSAPGATYQVLGSPDLLNWTNVGAPIVASNTVTSATVAITTSSNFFSVTAH